MRRNQLQVDFAWAVVVALVVIVISPGPAVDGMLGVAVIAVLVGPPAVGRVRTRRRAPGAPTLTAAERSARRQAERARDVRQ